MNAMLNIQIRVASQQANAALRGVQGQVNALNASGAKAASGLGAMDTRIGKMMNLQKFGKNLQWTGRQLEYNFTLPIVLAGAAATKFALDNEKAATSLRKVYGELGEDQAKLRKETDALATSFELLSSRYGAAQSEVIGIGAAWAQAGAAGVAVAKATKLTLDAMIIGDMDAIEATRGVIAVQSAYRQNTEQLHDTLAQLNIIENQTSIGFHDLIDVITRAGGTARTAGIDVRHLAAMAATLVPATGSAAQAGNALRTMISRLMAPTGEASDLMKKMGINILDASWQAKNGVQRIETMALAFNDLTQSQKAVVSSSVASRWQINRFDILMEDIAKSLDTATANQSAYNRALQATADQGKANQVYAKELLTVLESSPKAFSILMRSIQNALAKAIMPLLPALIGVLSTITKMVKWFADLSPEVQSLALAFLVLLAVVGPIVRYIGSFTLLFTTVGEAVVWFATTLFGLTDAQIAAAVAAQGHNASLIQQHGLIGALAIGVWRLTKFLVALPFVAVGKAAYAMWWSIGKAGVIAAQIVKVAWEGILLIGPYLYKGFRALIGGLGTLASSMAAAVAQGVASAASFTVSVMQTVLGVATGLWQKSLAVMRGMLIIFSQGVSVVWWGLVGLVTRVGTAISAAWATVSQASAAVWGGFVTVVSRIWSALPAFAAAAGAAVARAWRTAMFIAGMSTQIFVAAITRLPAIVASVATTIGTIWSALPAIFAGIGQAIWILFSTPLGWVILAVVAALAAIIYAIVKFRDDFGNIIQSALNNLPEAFVNAFTAVVNIVRKAALAVYEWLSYLNPFARHSPSLVEQVRLGISTILDEYSRLNGVDAIIKRAIASMEGFKSATGGAATDFRMADYSQKKAEILKVSPNAGPAIDSLISSINEMYGALDKVTLQLRDQEDLVNSMAADLEAAMKPYTDALFENEMQQKALRLEILKMKQAGVSIDDITDKMARLAGEIETLRAEQTTLRQAGAGSDVLAFYDQQIGALESQRDALAGQMGPIEELQKKLDELQLQGEIMDLEKSLAFDPQIKALDEQKQKLQELNSAYSDINSTIGDMEQMLSSMAQAAKQATDALDQSNAEKMFDAAAAGDFAVPGGNTPPGLGREGGLADIEAFNKQMEDELNAALDNMGIDMFAPIKDAWNAAWGWIKDNVGPVLQPVVDAVSGFFSNLFSGVDMGGAGGIFATIGSILSQGIDILVGWLSIAKAVFDFLVEALGPVFAWLGDKVEEGVKKIGGELKNWAPLWDQFTEAVGHVAKVVSFVFMKVIVPIIKAALGVILVIWKAVWPVLRTVVEPIFDAIIGIIRGALEVIRGVISFVLAIINGDWGKAWDALVTIVDGVWDTIYSVISGFIGTIVGIVKGLVEAVVGFFQWLYDILVGHSIIPDMVNAIVKWFEFLWGAIKSIWNVLWTAIKWTWDNVAKPVFNAIKWTIDNVLLPAFNVAKSTIKTVWDTIGSIIKTAWNSVIKPIFDTMKSLFTTISDTWLWVTNSVIKPVWDAISGAVKKAWDTMGRIIGAGVNFFIDVFNALAGAINAVSSALGLGFHIATKAHVGVVTSTQGNPNKSGAMLAAGGMVKAGGPGFMTNGVSAIVGEGNPLWPEFVIPTDPRYRKNAFALLEQLGVELFAAGGIPGQGTVGNIIGGGIGAVSDFWNAVNDVRNKIGDMLPFAGDIMGKIVGWVVDKVGNLVTGAIESARDAAWDVGAVVNPVDDIVNVFRAQGGTIPNLAGGGIVMPSPGGTLVNVAERGQAEVIQPLPSDHEWGGRTFNFYGDLSFPNITDPDDAEKFISNLETLASA